MKDFANRIINDLQQHSTYDQLLLDDLRELLEEHFEQEDTRWIHAVVDQLWLNLEREFALEAQAGYLVEALERFPCWEMQVRRLQQDHVSLHDEVALLRQQLDDPLGDTRIPRELRERFHDWLEKLASHKHRENMLLLDAVDLDVGGEC